MRQPLQKPTERVLEVANDNEEDDERPEMVFFWIGMAAVVGIILFAVNL